MGRIRGRGNEGRGGRVLGATRWEEFVSGVVRSSEERDQAPNSDQRTQFDTMFAFRLVKDAKVASHAPDILHALPLALIRQGSRGDKQTGHQSARLVKSRFYLSTHDVARAIIQVLLCGDSTGPKVLSVRK